MADQKHTPGPAAPITHRESATFSRFMATLMADPTLSLVQGEDVPEGTHCSRLDVAGAVIEFELRAPVMMARLVGAVTPSVLVMAYAEAVRLAGALAWIYVADFRAADNQLNGNDLDAAAKCVRGSAPGVQWRALVGRPGDVDMLIAHGARMAMLPFALEPAPSIGQRVFLDIGAALEWARDRAARDHC